MREPETFTEKDIMGFLGRLKFANCIKAPNLWCEYFFYSGTRDISSVEYLYTDDAFRDELSYSDFKFEGEIIRYTTREMMQQNNLNKFFEPIVIS